MRTVHLMLLSLAAEDACRVLRFFLSNQDTERQCSQWVIKPTLECAVLDCTQQRSPKAITSQVSVPLNTLCFRGQLGPPFKEPAWTLPRTARQFTLPTIHTLHTRPFQLYPQSFYTLSTQTCCLPHSSCIVTKLISFFIIQDLRATATLENRLAKAVLNPWQKPF